MKNNKIIKVLSLVLVVVFMFTTIGQGVVFAYDGQEGTAGHGGLIMPNPRPNPKPVVGVYGDSINDTTNNKGRSVNKSRSVSPPINNGFDDGVAPVDPIADHGIKYHNGYNSNHPPVKKTQPGNPIDFIHKKLGLNPINPNNNNYLNNSNHGQSFLVAHTQFAVVSKQGQPPYKYYWSVTGLPGMTSFNDPYTQKPILTIKVPVKDGKAPVSFLKDINIVCKVTDANGKTYTSTFKTTIKLKNN